VYFNPYGAMYIGGGILNDAHRHYTASASFSLEGDYRIRADGSGGWQTLRGSLVAPNVEQQMDARDCRIVILQIDPESSAYDKIARWFDSGPLQPLPDELTYDLARETRLALEKTDFDVFDLWTRLIARLSALGSLRRQIDRRIAQALAILKQDILSPPSAADLAHSVGLSQGRLIHLFTREVGLPIRRYVLWLRLREVMFSLAEGATMTEAGHAAGFADSAHLSRTFRDMFGLPPSVFLKTSRAIKVVFVLPPEDEVPRHPTERAMWARLRAKLGPSRPPK
jgi:AraC-like DNA-binding protein